MLRLIKNYAILCFCLFAGVSAAAGGELGATLQRIKETRAITIGYREALLPLSYLDDKQQPIGFSIDLCGLIVEKVKQKLGLPELKVNYKPVTASDSTALVQSGTLDIDCGSAAKTVEREQKASFSVAIYLPEYRWLVLRKLRVEGETRSRRRHREIKIPESSDDLKGKTIALTEGSASTPIILNLSDDRSLGLSIVHGKDAADSLLLVQSGRAAAFFERDISLLGLKANAQNPDALVFLDDSYRSNPYCLELRKDDKPFLELVDGALIEAMKSGEYDRLYSKWFESPIPPKEVNLSYPMPAALKAFVKLNGKTAE